MSVSKDALYTGVGESQTLRRRYVTRLPGYPETKDVSGLRSQPEDRIAGACLGVSRWVSSCKRAVKAHASHRGHGGQGPSSPEPNSAQLETLPIVHRHKATLTSEGCGGWQFKKDPFAPRGPTHLQRPRRTEQNRCNSFCKKAKCLFEIAILFLTGCGTIYLEQENRPPSLRGGQLLRASGLLQGTLGREAACYTACLTLYRPVH